jgi:hypothetical protein
MRRYQKAGGAASGVKNSLPRAWSNRFHQELHDVSRCPELPEVSGGAQVTEDVLEAIPKYVEIPIWHLECLYITGN